jgi:hypothetical protein
MMRLMRTPAVATPDGPTSMADTLFGTYEVGYPKDIVRWTDEAELKSEMEQRVKILNASQTRVATFEEAQKYFRGAALRNEAIFVSYSSEDRDMAAKLIGALRRRFQQVFDYRGKDMPILQEQPGWQRYSRSSRRPRWVCRYTQDRISRAATAYTKDVRCWRAETGAT